MSKRIALMAAAAALAISPALAQQTTPAPDGTTAQPPAQTTQPMAPSGQTARDFIPSQAPNQWLASELMGTSVMGSDNESIGSIENLLVDESGEIVGVVIGVGGFLGIGQKEVAVPFEALDLVRAADGKDQARLQLTKAELEKAPDFKTVAEERRAAGQQPQQRPGGTPPAGTR